MVEMASEIIERMKVDGTHAQLAEKNGLPVAILAPACAESDKQSQQITKGRKLCRKEM